MESILITSDDGYNSAGVRILARLLKGKYNIKIAGSKYQQSGVGGIVHLKDGGKWTKEEVEGVEALCIDVSPCDAVECAAVYYKDIKFDIVISGINWGPNTTNAIISSGTFSAGYRAYALSIAPRVVVLSIILNIEEYFRDHDGSDEISHFEKYPGKTVIKLLNLFENNNYYESKILNVNFPQKATNEVRFGYCLDKVIDFWPGRAYVNQNGTFNYLSKEDIRHSEEENSDGKLLLDGYIVVTPCVSNFTDYKSFNKYKTQKITL